LSCVQSIAGADQAVVAGLAILAGSPLCSL
jgi:hypothetical protein